MVLHVCRSNIFTMVMTDYTGVVHGDYMYLKSRGVTRGRRQTGALAPGPRKFAPEAMPTIAN